MQAARHQKRQTREVSCQTAIFDHHQIQLAIVQPGRRGNRRAIAVLPRVRDSHQEQALAKHALVGLYHVLERLVGENFARAGDDVLV